MGKTTRIKKVVSNVFSRKSHFLRSTKHIVSLLCLVASFGLLSSCGTTGVKDSSPYVGQKNPKPPKGYSPAVAIKITFLGDNTNAVFHPEKNEIVFISSLREKHKHSQIYQYSIDTKKEKRVTYHDGENTSVSFHPRGEEIIYSSSTDEIKERPKLLFSRSPSQEEFAPTELYLSNLFGSDIRRLTQKPLADLDAQMHPVKSEFIFSTLIDDVFQIYQKSIYKNQMHPIIVNNHNKRFPTFSPDGKTILWQQKQDAINTIWTATFRGKNSQRISQTSSNDLHPSWHPNGEQILFSSDSEDKTNIELFVMNKDGSCRQRLTYNVGQDLFARFNSKGDKIVFSSDRSGSQQIYLMDYKPPPPCNASKVSLN